MSHVLIHVIYNGDLAKLANDIESRDDDFIVGEVGNRKMELYIPENSPVGNVTDFLERLTDKRISRFRASFGGATVMVFRIHGGGDIKASGQDVNMAARLMGR